VLPLAQPENGQRERNRTLRRHPESGPQRKHQQQEKGPQESRHLLLLRGGHLQKNQVLAREQERRPLKSSRVEALRPNRGAPHLSLDDGQPGVSVPTLEVVHWHTGSRRHHGRSLSGKPGSRTAWRMLRSAGHRRRGVTVKTAARRDSAPGTGVCGGLWLKP
jgi:hypothetical protein